MKKEDLEKYLKEKYSDHIANVTEVKVLRVNLQNLPDRYGQSADIYEKIMDDAWLHAMADRVEECPDENEFEYFDLYF